MRSNMLWGADFEAIAINQRMLSVQEAKERYYLDGAYPLPLPTGFAHDHLNMVMAMV